GTTGWSSRTFRTGAARSGRGRTPRSSRTAPPPRAGRSPGTPVRGEPDPFGGRSRGCEGSGGGLVTGGGCGKQATYRFDSVRVHRAVLAQRGGEQVQAGPVLVQQPPTGFAAGRGEIQHRRQVVRQLAA